MTHIPSPPARQSALVLLTQARRALVEASTIERPSERYAATHLAALRAAAAVLAARARPVTTVQRRSSRPTSAWTLLCRVAPELSEWAGFFAAGAAKRAAAEAGLPRSVTAREADDMLRDADTFLAVVETTLGVLVQPMLTSSGRG